MIGQTVRREASAAEEVGREHDVGAERLHQAVAEEPRVLRRVRDVAPVVDDERDAVLRRCG